MTTNQNTIKKTVVVTMTKVIEVELMPSMFGDMTEEQFIAKWRKGLWNIDGIDDVIKHAAWLAANYGSGIEHDGVGLVGYDHMTHPRVPDVKFREISDESEEEFQP